MDAAVRVSWSDGQVSHHRICNLPELAPEALGELLEQELVDWLEPSELPCAPDGSALAWLSVQIVSAEGHGLVILGVPSDEASLAELQRPHAQHGELICGTSEVGAAMAELLEQDKRRQQARRGIIDVAPRPRTRYERLLNIPPWLAATHKRGTPWRENQMCPAQWRQLQRIRERDRERRHRSRNEH